LKKNNQSSAKQNKLSHKKYFKKSLQQGLFGLIIAVLPSFNKNISL